MYRLRRFCTLLSLTVTLSLSAETQPPNGDASPGTDTSSNAGKKSAAAADTVKLCDRLDSLSYILGRDVGGQLKDFGTKIKMSPFMLGINQAIGGAPSRIDSVAANTMRKEFAAQASEHMQKEQREQSEKNTKLGETFLAENKKRRGVQTTKSGLQYLVLKKSKGPKPSTTDSVLVQYKGMLLDSTVIDSTASDQPAGFNLQRILPGLSEGIQLMNVGSAYRLFIPPDLAYGEQGVPPNVPPSSVLIFDVTLKKIIEKK